MRTKKRHVLNFEHLEDRLTPTFDPLVFNPTTATWMLVQNADSGAVTVQVDAVGDLHLLEGVSDINLGVAPANLQVKMLDNSGDLTSKFLWVDLDSQLAGNLTLTLGNGDRVVGFMGSNNSIGGNLSVTAGNGAQRVNLATASGGVANFSASGSASINLGLGDDSVVTTGAGLGVSVGTDFSLQGVNRYDANGVGATIVGRNMTVNVSGETQNSFVFLNSGLDRIGGGFTYQGNNAAIEVIGVDTARFGGTVYLTLANGNSTVSFTNSVIGGGFTAIGGSGTESITLTGTTVGGNVYVNGGTMGASTISLTGTIGGSSVQVITGLDNDSVTYGMKGTRPQVNVNLGLGSDTFTLNSSATTSLGYLYVDFGAGVDTYNNLYGLYTFPAVLRNLP